VVLDGDERKPMHIGSPVLPCGDAKTKSEEIKKLCETWGVKKENPETIPVFVGFDTTSTNTGRVTLLGLKLSYYLLVKNIHNNTIYILHELEGHFTGTILRIEAYFGQKMGWAACMHHVLEIIGAFRNQTNKR
jgi:hypothetical protein